MTLHELLRKAFFDQRHCNIIRAFLDVKETNELSQIEYRKAITDTTFLYMEGRLSQNDVIERLRYIAKGHKK